MHKMLFCQISAHFVRAAEIAPVIAHKKIKAIMDSFLLTDITAEKTANTSANGRIENVPSSEIDHTLNEQNFHKATPINTTDTGLSIISRNLTIRLFRQRFNPANTVLSMK
jgi:hypothetical protein